MTKTQPTTAPTPAERSPQSAPAQGETPRTNRLRDSVLDAFSRFHKGQIYLEDFAEFVRLAFNDAAHIESELNAAEHSNMNHREYIHRLEADRATLRQSLAAVKKERDEARAELPKEAFASNVAILELRAKLTAAESELAELRKALAGGAGRIAKERLRHVSQEGWDAEHDDMHTDGSLRVVAAMLAVKGTDATVEDPLDRDDWNLGRHPLERRLEIAGALIAAELDRVERRDAARNQQEKKE